MIVVNKVRLLTGLCLFVLLSIFGQTFAQDLKMLTSAEELIAAASEGGSYELAAGSFELEDTLLIEKDFSLYGAGMDSTTIITKAEFLGVSVHGDISVVFEGISFEHQGDLQEDVVEIKDAHFSIKSCSFSGGLWQEVEEDAEFVYGAGLWLHGSANGEISNSVFVDNDADGINISSDVQLRIDNSVISNNGWQGVLLLENSQVFADNVVLENNGDEGIAVSGESYLRLINSTVEGNGLTTYVP